MWVLPVSHLVSIRLNFPCAYVHVCADAHVCACTLVNAAVYMEAKGHQPRVFLDTGFLTGLELAKSVGLAGREPWESIHLCSPGLGLQV